MRVWKLVAGIISMILFFVIMLQSCAAGTVNALENNGGSSGSFGLICGILILVGGIISVVSAKAEGNGSNVALLIVFALAALLGFIGFGNYSDLVIWSIWASVNAVFAIIAMIKNR